MFMGELALELGIPVSEMQGPGSRLSAWELTVFWPNFFATRKREQKRAAKEAADN